MEPMTQGETNYIQVHLRILEDNDALHIFQLTEDYSVEDNSQNSENFIESVQD